MRVSPSYYNLSRIKPLLGRTFLPEEDQYGRDHVVILSHDLWVNHFGEDRAIVGRTIRLDNEPYTVVGVMPAGSVFDRTAFQIAKPMGFAPFKMTRSLHWLGAFARLKPGVTVQQARAQMDALAAQFAKTYPDTNNGFGIIVDPFADVLVGPQLRTSLYVLFAAAGMVLLIGCANLANLALARGMQARTKKSPSVRRSALGEEGWCASSSPKTFYFPSWEEWPGSASATPLSTGCGWRFLHIRSQPRQASNWMASVLLFALGISSPHRTTIWLSSGAATNQAGSQRRDEGGWPRRDLFGGARLRLQNALIIAEVAVAFVLWLVAGVLIRSFYTLQNVDTGLTPPTCSR